MYYDGGDFSSESLYADILLQGISQVSRWYYGQKNDDYANLKGTARTLDGANGEKFPLVKELCHVMAFTIWMTALLLYTIVKMMSILYVIIK